MDIVNIKNKVSGFFSKYKFAALILIIGIVLMQIPVGGTKTETKSDTEAATSYEITVEEKLGEILSAVKGAGNVQVFLSEATGVQTIYQTDTTASSTDSGTNESTKVVTVTDSQRNESGLVLYKNAPAYRGALVVCEGADDVAVKYAIINAVASVTGLKSDCITVLKMK